MPGHDNHIPKKEVSIEYPLFESKQGRYFIGETPLLSGTDGKALVALVNPSNSGVNIYLNAITITNILGYNLSAEIFLKSKFTGGIPSTLVSPTNIAFNPQSAPQGSIEYVPTTTQGPSDGVSIFTRVASPYSTLVIDGGQIIIPSGQSIVVYLGGLIPIKPSSTIVAFGWWEEPLYNCCTPCK